MEGCWNGWDALHVNPTRHSDRIAFPATWAEERCLTWTAVRSGTCLSRRTSYPSMSPSKPCTQRPDCHTPYPTKARPKRPPDRTPRDHKAEHETGLPTQQGSDPASPDYSPGALDPCLPPSLAAFLVSTRAPIELVGPPAGTFSAGRPISRSPLDPLSPTRPAVLLVLVTPAPTVHATKPLDQAKPRTRPVGADRSKARSMT